MEPWYEISFSALEISLLDIDVRTTGGGPISVEIADAQKDFVTALVALVYHLEVEKFEHGGRKGLIPKERIEKIIQNAIDSPLARFEEAMEAEGWFRDSNVRGKNFLIGGSPYNSDKPPGIVLIGKISFTKEENK